MTYSPSLGRVVDWDEEEKRQKDAELHLDEVTEKAAIQEEVADLDAGKPEPQPGQVQPKNIDSKGDLKLREGEIIGPTAEPGEYEPAGYVPGSIMDPNTNSPLRPIGQVVEPIAAGVHDWFADEINSKANIWGYDEIPRWRKMDNELQDATRDLTALLAPLILYTKGAKGAAKKVHASGIAPARLQALGNDPAFKLLANLGVDVGVGVYVDSTASQQEEEHNLGGNLKNWFPDQTKWIPNWWATSDNDSPDTFRHKNRQEGAGLNMGVELIGAGARFVRAAHGAWKQARWVPKNEQAGEFFANLSGRYKDSAVRNTFENLARSAEQRSKNLDDVGDYLLSKMESSVIDQPIKGVHDMWDVAETGMRSVDEADVASAMVSAARIKDNIGTQYGRVANFISPAALKKAVDEGPEWLLDQVTDRIKQAGNFDYITSEGVKLSDKSIKSATTQLAETLMDPMADSGFIAKMVQKVPESIIRSGAVNDAVKGYMDKIYNLEKFQADALLQTSASGQIADMSDSLLENLDYLAADNLKDEIWDRVETLLNVKGLSDWNKQQDFYNPNFIERLASRFKNKPDAMAEFMSKNESARAIARTQIVGQSKQFLQTLKQINQEKPHFLKPMYEMYDATNGKVNTMYGLNKQFMQEMADASKLFVDPNPDMPNRMIQAGWANVMNSTLSGFGTPIAAAIGGVTGLLSKPATQMIGAVMSGDFYSMRRTFHAYSSLGQTMDAARRYAHDVYMKVSTEPEKYMELVRPDLQIQRDDRMQALRSYAEAALTDGNEGPAMLVEQLKQLEDLHQHPLMRWSGNTMSAMDAYVNAFMAQVQAKSDAFDFVEGRLSMDDIVRGSLGDQELYAEGFKRSYDNMFDADGVLTDQRVKYASQEINMQLNDGVSNALGQLTRYSPIMRSVFMFPRAQGNMLSLFAKYNPAQPLIGQFVGDLQAFTMKPLKEYSGPEIMEALQNRGIVDISPDAAMQKFIELRQEAKGRWAMGTLGVMGAWQAFTQDRITGDNTVYGEAGLDRQARQLGKPTRSYKIPGIEKWVSYEALGPVGDWLATTVNAMDNFDRLTEVQIEEIGNKLAFVAGAAIKDKNAMMNFQVVNDILSGNEGALNRYLAGTFNNAIPGAGQRGEWGRLFSDTSREIERDIIGYARNRNKFADVFVPEDARLPESTDWIYGKPVGHNPSFMTRVWNTYNKGAMISDDMGPEARFLDVVGFNSMPQFNESPEGIPYTNTERAELYHMVGKDGLFLQTIRNVMKRAEKEGSLERLMDLKSDWWNTSDRVPKDKFMGIHNELAYGLNVAVSAARGRLSTRDRIEHQSWINNVNEARAATGQEPLSSQAENFLLNLPTR